MLMLLLSFSLALQDEAGVLMPARDALRSMAYQDCIERSQKVHQQVTESREVRADALMLSGICAAQLSRNDEASDYFAQAIADNVNVMLPPTVSPKIAELFAIQKALAKSSLREPKLNESNALPDNVRESPVLKSLPPTALQSTPGRSVFARVPTGAWVTWAAAALALASGITFGVLADARFQQSQTVQFSSDRLTAYQLAQTNAVGANISFGVAGVALAGGVLWAVLAPKEIPVGAGP
jgi:hypothetical protein